MRNLIILLTLVPFIAFSQADDVKINATAMKGIDFKQYQSYAWLPFVDSVKTNEFDKQALDQQITAAVNAELQSRGWKIDDAAPQVYLMYSILLDRQEGYVSEPVYGRPNVGLGVGFGRGGFGGVSVGVSSPGVVGSETKKVMYRKGALLIDVIDNSTKQSIWRGTANRTKEDKGELVNAKLVIEEVVPKIFKKFPVKKVK